MKMKRIHRKIELALNHLDDIPKENLGDLKRLIRDAAYALSLAEEITRDLAKDTLLTGEDDA